jgi:tRNA pseudouridine38-40 synthase
VSGDRGRTTRWLVRFGYDGAPFAGWARQPGLSTVEGELRRGLVRLGAVPRGSDIDLEVASRTDRGVSARANAFALRADHSGPTLLRMLNGLSSSIWCTAATPVPDDFRVRAASRRVYRYFDPLPSRRADRQAAAARLFSGAIDVRSLGRGLPSEKPVWRTIESVSVRPARSGSVVEARAPSFVWGMVRKIVAALREVDAGRLSPERLADALAGRIRLTLPMAEPEPLVLWDVEYPLRWQFSWTGPSRRDSVRWDRNYAALRARRRVLDAILPTSGRRRASAAQPTRSQRSSF